MITNAEVGKTVGTKELLVDNDAVLLAVGSTWPRDLPIPGTLVIYCSIRSGP